MRGGVGILDGSTLGKIDVQGPDAAAFLDLLYTNMISSLKVGSIRYGVMCKTDGMVLDDGTVLRLGQDRFLVYTTTGGAAGVLDWMEDWLQTEWPHLRVHVTSVTEQWATFPVVGPRSRDVVAAVTGLDTSQAAFPFMTWQDTRIGDARLRVARVSFSGELAFEVNVDGWHAMAVWERLVAAGKPYGITPYGTETMHVLRAEKAYPIIGQDTDGTVTPQDLGMTWAVSKKKADFLGKRSFARADNNRADRKQLVGLLPVDRTVAAARGVADRRGPRSSGTPCAHARARHLELPQRGAGPDVRPRPGEGAAGPASGRRCTWPSRETSSPSRSPSPSSSTPKEPAVTAETLTPDRRRSRRGGTRSTTCPTGCRSPRDRSSRWPTSRSSPGARRRTRSRAPRHHPAHHTVDVRGERVRHGDLAGSGRVADHQPFPDPGGTGDPSCGTPSVTSARCGSWSRLRTAHHPAAARRARARPALRRLLARPAPTGVRPRAPQPRRCSAKPGSC